MSNNIVLENQKPGNPEAEWGLLNGASSSIEGFTTDISTDVGGTVDFKINTDASQYRLDIYRLGYYNGDGARLVASIGHNGAVSQPDPLVDLSRATVDAGNWSVTDTWTVPADAVSGVYIAKLVREDGTPGENHIPFIVREDGGHSDIVFQTSDTTWQAYNKWGGASLYQNDITVTDPALGYNRAYAVSYNRPLDTTSLGSVLNMGEYQAIRFLEANGYDVSYISGVDTARSGAELLEHQVFLSTGHDEYWSADQRANVEAARDAGVNLAFWGGNDVYWKTRWEPSLDSTPDAYRTMVTYKESWAGAKIDPNPQWTGTWRDPMDPTGAHPENALTGTMFVVNSTNPDTIAVSSDYSKLRFWANTDISQLQPGQSVKLAPGTLGYEWNVDPDNGFRPDGLVDLSSTTVFVNSLLTGTSDISGIVSGNATHSLTLYRADSGALVFSAGTIFWGYALDSHNPNGVQADANVQQAMVNLLAEMGAQPGTLKSGLVPTAASTDHTAPQATILSYSASIGNTSGVSGSATDFGGGVVAGIEVSTDGGLTWHKGTGSANWTYTWVPDKLGPVTIEARAVDDSVNLGASATLQGLVWFKDPGFDPSYYLATYTDIKASDIDPYFHYINYGWKEGRNPNAVFSTNDYLDANPDVATSGENPLTHYETIGWKEGRDPSASFDTRFYLDKNPDIAGLNPLDHYIAAGQSEGRTTYASVGHVGIDGTSTFDTEYYLLQNRDIASVHDAAFAVQHYDQYGWKEGRDPNPYFDSKAYLEANPDIAASGMDPLLHYDLYGWKEGRDPSPNFDTKAYLEANPDIAAGINPLWHFLYAGIYEGRDPHGDGQMAGSAGVITA